MKEMKNEEKKEEEEKKVEEEEKKEDEEKKEKKERKGEEADLLSFVIPWRLPSQFLCGFIQGIDVVGGDLHLFIQQVLEVRLVFG